MRHRTAPPGPPTPSDVDPRRPRVARTPAARPASYLGCIANPCFLGSVLPARAVAGDAWLFHVGFKNATGASVRPSGTSAVHGAPRRLHGVPRYPRTNLLDAHRREALQQTFPRQLPRDSARATRAGSRAPRRNAAQRSTPLTDGRGQIESGGGVSRPSFREARPATAVRPR